MRLADRHSTAQHAWQIPRHCAAYLVRAGYLVLSRQLLETAKEAAARPGSDPRAEAACLVNLGMVVDDLGECQIGLEYVKLAVASAQRVGDREGETALLSYLADSHRRNGRYREAADVAQRAVELYREQGDRGMEVVTLSLHMLALVALGRPVEALQRYSPPLEQDDDRICGVLFEALGIAASRAGQHVTALEHLRRAIDCARTMNDRIQEGSRLHRLAEAQRRAGQPDEALRHAVNAHRLLGEHPSINDVVESQNTLGAIYLDLGRHDEALAHFTTALHHARGKGVHLERARAFGGIGDALASLGDLDGARQNRQQASEIYKALDLSNY